MKLKRHEVQEHVSFAGGRSYLGEEIDALGIEGVTSELYHAVVDAPCGRGGRRNINRRIYVPEEYREAHEGLAVRAREEWIGGELGHPKPGQDTWNIALRFLDGWVEEGPEPGTNTAHGRFGILRTTQGENLFTLWRAGKPVGVSLKALVFMREEVIDPDSRWAAGNPEVVGERAIVCSGMILKGYDAVVLASAGTNFPEAVREGGDLPVPPPDEIEAAMVAVMEAGLVRSPDAPQEEKNDDMTLQELLEKFPDLVEQIRTETREAAEAASPLAGLSQGDKDLIASVIEHLDVDKAKNPEEYRRALAVVEEQGHADRTRIVELEGRKADLEKLVEEQGKRLQEIEASLAAEKLQREVLEAVDAKAATSKRGPEVKALVLKNFDAGRLTSVEEAVDFFAEIDALVGKVEQPAPPASAGPADDTPTEEVSEEAEPVEEGATAPAPEEPPQAPGALNANPNAKQRGAAIAALRRRR